MLEMKEWDGFEGRLWKEEINVRDFIQNNYTPYDGDESFLAGPTEATNKLWGKLQELQKEERAKGGVLDMETKVVAGLTAYGPGYIDESMKELEQVVGLQTDKPLKRAFMPYGGIKMAEEALEMYGYKPNENFHKLRILIMSDSHGRNENVELAIAQVREEIGEFQMLIHLGDVGDAREIESLAGVPCYIVRGNTDYDAKLLNANVIEASGHRIFATHGHLYQVDMRLDLLRFAALENDCDIAMYGHTHVPYLEEDPDDITILNPGSISKPRQADHRYTYMVMEIDDEDEVTYELRYVE